MAKPPSPTPEASVDARGQIMVTLGGADYVLRPDWVAIEAIERALGRALFILAGQAVHGGLSLSDLGIITAELMKGHGRADPQAGPSYSGASPAKVSELIYEAGAPKVTGRLAIILAGAVAGGYTASGEVKAAT